MQVFHFPYLKILCTCLLPQYWDGNQLRSMRLLLESINNRMGSVRPFLGGMASWVSRSGLMRCFFPGSTLDCRDGKVPHVFRSR